MNTPTRRLAIASLASVLVVAPLISSPGAQGATKALICRAYMSDATPSQYSHVDVYVKTGKPKARVRTVAHYKTTKTAHSRTSNSQGKATVPYYISRATPGYKVVVTVTVAKNGKSRSCRTSFRAHR